MNLNELSPILVSIVNSLLLAALPVLVGAIVNALLAWGRVQWANLKASQPLVADQVAFYVRIAVEAAQQAGIAKLITDKKAYALDITLRWLSQNGLDGIDIELIEAEIERQVRDMKSTPAVTG